jgi:transcriptional regulator with XRE-family HTH domain
MSAPWSDRRRSRRDRVAWPSYHFSLKAIRPPKVGYPRKPQTLGDHLRKRRMDLGLFQKEVAERIGVNVTSVYNWEKNVKAPSLRVIPKIIEFLGCVPKTKEAKTLGQRIVACRRLLGMSQKELARRLGVDPGTLGKWERDKRKPPEELLEALRLLKG